MNEDSMNKCQAVHCLMEIMNRAKNEIEVEALQIACRNLVKRWSDQKKNKAKRVSMKEAK